MISDSFFLPKSTSTCKEDHYPCRLMFQVLITNPVVSYFRWWIIKVHKSCSLAVCKRQSRYVPHCLLGTFFFSCLIRRSWIHLRHKRYLEACEKFPTCCRESFPPSLSLSLTSFAVFPTSSFLSFDPLHQPVSCISIFVSPHPFAS